MIFENEHLSVHLLDVLFLDQENVSMLNAGRHFDALSFRIRSDAHMQTATGDYSLTDGSLCFVPSHTDYRRTASYDKMLVVHFHAAEYVGRDIECMMPKDPERTEALFWRLWQEFRQKKVGWFYRCTALLYEILGICCEEQAHSSAPTLKIAAAVNYLSTH